MRLGLVAGLLLVLTTSLGCSSLLGHARSCTSFGKLRIPFVQVTNHSDNYVTVTAWEGKGEARVKPGQTLAIQPTDGESTGPPPWHLVIMYDSEAKPPRDYYYGDTPSNPGALAVTVAHDGSIMITAYTPPQQSRTCSPV